VTTRASVVAATMHRASQLAREWQGKVVQDPVSRRLYTSWMPFNTGEFTGLLAQAIDGYEPGPDENVRFLDVGCGPGPELLIARDIFGLDILGFDRVPEYVAAACSLGLRATVADAGSYPGYGLAQVTWFNRVARDAGIQAQIEAKVWRDTAPGAVVICANLENPPPGWFPVLDDQDARRGIYMKPGHADHRLVG
jgi:SAM-dependent methyltransferase